MLNRAPDENYFLVSGRDHSSHRHLGIEVMDVRAAYADVPKWIAGLQLAGFQRTTAHRAEAERGVVSRHRRTTPVCTRFSAGDPDLPASPPRISRGGPHIIRAMSILKIARMGHPVLRAKARALHPSEIRTPKIQQLIDDLFETMKEYQGVGLAAPQVHEGLRIFVAGLPPRKDADEDEDEDREE